MPDFDPDAYLSSSAPPSAAAAGGFDPDAYLSQHAGPGGAADIASAFGPVGAALSGHLPLAATDVPSEIKSAATDALSSISRLNPFSDRAREIDSARSGIGDLTPEWERFKDVGAGLAGIPALVASPVTGAARSLIGHPYSELTGIPYDKSKEAVDLAMSAMGPGRGGMRAPVPVPRAPVPDALGVTLSEGQRTGDLPLIRSEQAAIRGQRGAAAQDQAGAFAAQQADQVDQASNNIARSLDPFGMVVADTPADAGAVVSQSVRDAATNAKAGVNDLYRRAREMPGEIDADVFTNMGRSIRDDLSNRAEPVIIDDQLTPYASKAVQDIDNRVAQLRVQNRASNTSSVVPADEAPTISGLTLAGVDQMRKRLSAMRQAAFGSGNASDGRAVKAVLDSFDDTIDRAINGGSFTGDPRAVQAWNDARAAHADYRSTFTAQKNDPVGRVVERITGKGNNPAAIPNDVADFLYGSSGTNPSTLNVGVANRMRQILGEQSPEWSAVKQGLFARLTETTPGMSDFGSGQIAQRLNKFLSGDGRELAQTMFSPAERQLLQQYADLHRRLQVPRTGANWSETSTFLSPILKRIQSTVGAAIGLGAGALVGHAAGIPFVGEAVGVGLGSTVGLVRNAIEARQVAKQMPLVSEAMAQYQRALAKANRANAPLSNQTLTIAASNLSNALAPMGIDFRKLAGSGSTPAQADQNQHERGGRVDDQPDQREPRQQKRFADGGAADDVDAQSLAANYARNRAWTKNGVANFNTSLGADEPTFRQWVASNKVPFDPDAKGPQDYDMRGFWQALQSGDSRAKSAIDPNDSQLHYPDYWKTPYHATFSSESQWAAPNAPRWNDRDQLVDDGGNVLFDDKAQQPAAGGFARGGRVRQKLVHKAVGYVDKSRLPHKHCSVCSMFREGPACTLVKSPIFPAGWCRRFDPKE